MLGRHTALQLIRAATSPAAKYAESQVAESRREFVHKLRIVLKELRETALWLRFAHRIGFGGTARFDETRRECDQLIAILATCIRTANRRLKT